MKTQGLQDISIEDIESLRFHCVLSLSIIDERWEINYGAGKEIVLQFLNTKGNLQWTEAFMELDNGNPFFGEDYPRY